MNYSTAVILLNKNIRTVQATYEPDRVGVDAKRSIFKTFDSSIQVDDIVVVPSTTRHIPSASDSMYSQ